jgi:hypothetical protein
MFQVWVLGDSSELQKNQMLRRKSQVKYKLEPKDELQETFELIQYTRDTGTLLHIHSLLISQSPSSSPPSEIIIHHHAYLLHHSPLPSSFESSSSEIIILHIIII